jgi:hypothetical protein
MKDLQLFRVTVTQTFLAEGEAFVWATNKDEAKKAARHNVDLDMDDVEAEDTEAIAWPEPVDTLLALTDKQSSDYWLIAPSSRPNAWDVLDLQQFRALLDPERMEQARLSAIERDNGQLALLGGTE